MKKSPVVQLKRGLLLFWSLWFFIVFMTNLFDVLRVKGILDSNFPAVSDNYLLVHKTTSIYNFPEWLNDYFYFSIVVWEAICCGYLMRGFLIYTNQNELSAKEIDTAFGLAIALFATFILACEIFIAYETEGVHMRVFTALIASLLFMKLVPD